MARTVAEELKQGEPERQVDFRISDGVAAIGDANLLRVVLDNLFGNAWKYTSTREKAVIEFGVTIMNGARTYFVRDNGRGFDMTDAENVFTPFKRLPGAEGSGGFGIGLATVKRVIQRHGGKAWAEGGLDKGACFYFSLGTPSDRREE
jgi:signal transduction histidine kinase